MGFVPNPKRGEIITVTDEDRRLVQDESLDLEEPPEWQRESVAKAREALESDNVLELPTQFEIHEWSIMERFATSLANDAQQDELLDAIRGAGAFRSFRSAIRRLGVENGWFQFRQSAFEQIARDWLESHGISYR